MRLGGGVLSISLLAGGSLEAQQQLYPTELNLAATRRDRLIAVVDLYRSLGGGWAPVPPGAAPTFPRPVSMP